MSASTTPTELPAVLFRGDGTWWLPENPAERRKGRLDCLVSHGVRLHLEGSFDVIDAKPFPWRPDIILGEAGGRLVTLHRCWRHDVQLLRPGSPVANDAVYAAEAALVGVHLPTQDDVRFHTLDVSYTGMPYWFSVFGVFMGNVHSTSYTDIGTVLAGDLTIRVVADFLPSEDAQVCIRGEKLLYLRFERDAPLALSEWQAGPVRLFRDFLTFALGTDTPPVRLRVSQATPTDVTSTVLGDIDAYVFGMNRPETDLVEPDYLLWSFDVDDGPGRCIQQWFVKTEQLQPVRQLYCDVIRRERTLAVILKFFLLMLGVEGYHRCARPGKYLADDEYDLVQEQVSRAVRCVATGDLRRSLLKRLEYGNELSLRRRLRELKRDLAMQLGDLDVPVDEMVNARNDFAHPDTPGTRRARSDVEFAVLADYAQAVLQASLLTEIGVSAEKAKEVIARQSHHADAQTEWRRLHPAAEGTNVAASGGQG